jgi:PKD repeat protein
MKITYLNRIVLFLLFGFLCSCNKEPTAIFAVQNLPASVGDWVGFESASIGADHYSWSFGDGGSSTLGDVTHYYTAPGTYVVKLTAYSRTGQSNSVSHPYTISPPWGKLIFYQTGTPFYYNTDVTIGSTTHAITAFFSSPPFYNNSGPAIFTLAPGYYTYTASEHAPGTHTWSGNAGVIREAGQFIVLP